MEEYLVAPTIPKGKETKINVEIPNLGKQQKSET
jgi:hypothetical protein